MDVNGTVRGGTIVLEDELPELEGKRVRVHVELLEQGEQLTPEQQRDLWAAWVTRGPHGPLEDDDGSAWP